MGISGELVTFPHVHEVHEVHEVHRMIRRRDKANLLRCDLLIKTSSLCDLHEICALVASGDSSVSLFCVVNMNKRRKAIGLEETFWGVQELGAERTGCGLNGGC